jgi:hypothetical protein
MKLEELTVGKIGSNQYLAFRIRFALNPIKIWGMSAPSEKERQWAIDLLAKAWENYDFDFIRGQLDGLEKLRLSDSARSRDPRFFLSRAYNFLQRTKGVLPFRLETISLAKRLWATANLTRHLPDLPLPEYEPAIERKISREMNKLPRQKWSRHFHALGLEFSPAKRGRKPKGK